MIISTYGQKFASKVTKLILNNKQHKTHLKAKNFVRD